MSHKWTNEEREFIKLHYQKSSSGKIAMMMGLGWQQVQGQIVLMKLKKKKQ